MVGDGHEPAAAKRWEVTDGMLHRLDATVAEATMCHCGCGHAACDSPWFATPHCQAAWYARFAADPEQVYAAQDAAMVWEGADQRPAPLTDPGVDDLFVTQHHAATGLSHPFLNHHRAWHLIRLLQAEMRQMAEHVTAFLETFSDVWEEAFGRVWQQLRHVAPQPPLDPRERALWLRRNRNTGPTPRKHRPPRTISSPSRRRDFVRVRVRGNGGGRR